MRKLEWSKFPQNVQTENLHPLPLHTLLKYYTYSFMDDLGCLK